MRWLQLLTKWRDRRNRRNRSDWDTGDVSMLTRMVEEVRSRPAHRRGRGRKVLP